MFTVLYLNRINKNIYNEYLQRKNMCKAMNYNLCIGGLLESAPVSDAQNLCEKSITVMKA